MKRVLQSIILTISNWIARVLVRMYFAVLHPKKGITQYCNRRFLSSIKRCGKCVRLNGSIHCTGMDHLELGNNVHINDNAYFRAEGGLYIGDNAHLSRNMTIYTINHEYTGKVLPYYDSIVKKPVRIDKNVWIGMNVCIVPGVHIQEGAIVGMGAVVTKDVPKCAIVGGNPAKILKYRDIEHYDRLDAQRRYGGVNGTPLDESSRT